MKLIMILSLLTVIGFEVWGAKYCTISVDTVAKAITTQAVK